MKELLAGLASQFENEALSNITGALGIPPTTAQTAIATALPAIAGALAKKAAQPNDAAGLMRIFGILTSMGSSQPRTMLSGLLSDPKAMHAGANMAQSLFGDQLGETAQQLTTRTGLSEDAATKLLGMVVPAVLGAIGTQAKVKSLDASSLASLFSAHDAPAAQPLAPAENIAQPADESAAQESTSITESLKRGLKRLFGRE